MLLNKNSLIVYFKEMSTCIMSDGPPAYNTGVVVLSECEEHRTCKRSSTARLLAPPLASTFSLEHKVRLIYSSQAPQ